MKTIFSLTLLAIACSAPPCEYTLREYTPPPMPDGGVCVGMLAQRGGLITPHDSGACDAMAGDCTVLSRSHYDAQWFPLYWVGSPDDAQPRFAAVPCSIHDCETIQRAVMAQGQ